MRYFRGGDWQEVEALPEETTLLVHSVGVDNVRKVNDALGKNEIPYYTAAERKDEVRFYVQRERRDEVELLVKQYFAQH